MILRVDRRVYDYYAQVVLCSRRTGRAFALNDPSVNESAIQIRVRGPYVRYVRQIDEAVSEGYYAFALDGRTGRVAAATYPLNPPFRVILKADGALATATGNGLAGLTEPGGEVRVYDHAGYRTLASGLGIMPLSLISAPGNVIRWRDGEQQMSAKVSGLGRNRRHLTRCRTITTCPQQEPERASSRSTPDARNSLDRHQCGFGTQRRSSSHMPATGQGSYPARRRPSSVSAAGGPGAMTSKPGL